MRRMALITYRIDVWNAVMNRYATWWTGSDFTRAEIMFNKPYVQYVTRRLVKMTEEVLQSERKKKT